MPRALCWCCLLCTLCLFALSPVRSLSVRLGVGVRSVCSVQLCLCAFVRVVLCQWDILYSMQVVLSHRRCVCWRRRVVVFCFCVLAASSRACRSLVFASLFALLSRWLALQLSLEFSISVVVFVSVVSTSFVPVERTRTFLRLEFMFKGNY